MNAPAVVLILIGLALFGGGYLLDRVSSKARRKRIAELEEERRAVERLAASLSNVVPLARPSAPGNATHYELPVLGRVRSGEMQDD